MSQYPYSLAVKPGVTPSGVGSWLETYQEFRGWMGCRREPLNGSGQWTLNSWGKYPSILTSAWA